MPGSRLLISHSVKTEVEIEAASSGKITGSACYRLNRYRSLAPPQHPTPYTVELELYPTLLCVNTKLLSRTLTLRNSAKKLLKPEPEQPRPLTPKLLCL